MVAASVWSLLIPSIENSKGLGFLSFIPAVVGFVFGIAVLIAVDRFIPLDKLFTQAGHRSGRVAIVVLSVTAHNLPEGIAVGAVYAALAAGEPDVSLAGALALSIGIGIQNFPEGAIISMPLYSSGVKKSTAFLVGMLSGIVEPIGAILAIVAAKYLSILPFLLSFAAGAMIYVVVEELIPEVNEGKGKSGIVSFTLGFLLMMALDVALG